jgi:hypothetical protein
MFLFLNTGRIKKRFVNMTLGLNGCPRSHVGRVEEGGFGGG